MAYTAEEKAAAARREARNRRRVYLNRVATGRMSRSRARFEIAVMEAIAGDYEAQAARERLL